MQFLSLILSVVSIFVGGVKGCMVWVIGTAIILAVAAGTVLTSVGSLPKLDAHGTPMFLAYVGINLVSIMISKWWGLVFNICATIGLFWIAMAGLL